MRALALLLALSLAGCADAERLLRDSVATPSGASGGTASGWPPTAAAYAVDPTGTWDTDWGSMTLRQHDGGRVTGTYEDGGSQIDARIRDNVITGYWIEPTSTRACDTTRGGSRHWGRIHYVLVSRDQWVGKYSYCDGSIGRSEADWDATRVR